MDKHELKTVKNFEHEIPLHDAAPIPKGVTAIITEYLHEYVSHTNSRIIDAITLRKVIYGLGGNPEKEIETQKELGELSLGAVGKNGMISYTINT